MVLGKYKKHTSIVCTTLALALAISACDPVPRHTLTTDEKIADMYWIYSQFGENYAPLDLKQKLYNFDYEKLKADYIEEAKKTTTNDEFYDLMYKFVAEFKDAHTSAALTNSSLPNRASVAFLGFNGFRKGDNYIVKSLLPTIKSTSSFPIKPGDVIVRMNGKPLKDLVDSEQLAYRNLGSKEANYTALMGRLFTRVSTVNGQPKETNATITVERPDQDAQDHALAQAQSIQDPDARQKAIDAANDKKLKKEVDLTIPWVVKDLSVFKKEQSDATPASSPGDGGGDDDGNVKAQTKAAASDPKNANFLMVDDDGVNPLKFNFIGFDGRVQMPFDLIQKVTADIRKKISDSFIFVDNYAEWKIAPVTEDAASKTSFDNLKENRAILKNATYIAGSNTFPAYIAPRDLLDDKGNKTGKKKLIGYLYIDTFSPSGDDKTVLAEVKSTLLSFQNMGVKDIIIDTMNNGGGSLVLGMKIAQALTNKAIAMPKMQVRLSDTWLDQYESETIHPDSDAEGESYRRILQTLKDEQKANPNQRLSTPLDASAILAPFEIQPNEDLDAPFHVVLLVNEMCASMCDIFAGILKDNNLATLVGTNTMGAGGNVVNHTQAPNSHIDVRQTESLILRADGTYLENSGVKPDVEIATSESSDAHYSAVLLKAIEQIVGKKADAAPAKKTDPKSDDGLKPSPSPAQLAKDGSKPVEAPKPI